LLGFCLYNRWHEPNAVLHYCRRFLAPAYDVKSPSSTEEALQIHNATAQAYERDLAERQQQAAAGRVPRLLPEGVLFCFHFVQEKNTLLSGTTDGRLIEWDVNRGIALRWACCTTTDDIIRGVDHVASFVVMRRGGFISKWTWHRESFEHVADMAGNFIAFRLSAKFRLIIVVQEFSTTTAEQLRAQPFHAPESRSQAIVLYDVDTMREVKRPTETPFYASSLRVHFDRMACAVRGGVVVWRLPTCEVLARIDELTVPVWRTVLSDNHVGVSTLPISPHCCDA
jgi:hypothetical protein